jgi:hypothetical protein
LESEDDESGGDKIDLALETIHTGNNHRQFVAESIALPGAATEECHPHRVILEELVSERANMNYATLTRLG